MWGSKDSHFRKTLTIFLVLSASFILMTLLKPAEERPAFYGKTLVAEAFHNEECPKRGAEDPKVELILFCDYASTACRDLQSVLWKLVDKYNFMSWTHKDYPLRGKTSIKAAEAARCAAKQEKFWDFHDILYQNQQTWNNNYSYGALFREYAEEAGLSVDEFNACIDFSNSSDDVSNDLKDARKSGIYTAPTILINNTILEYPYDYDRLEQAVKSEVRKGKIGSRVEGGGGFAALARLGVFLKYQRPAASPCACLPVGRGAQI
ncbi:MAG: thioredoxin domain-containing protein [Candidatus Gracilibacteria bacterium]|nr:thioredoxin domain-containing protein [Candidatus Gracilibacteria bacterium]